MEKTIRGISALSVGELCGACLCRDRHRRNFCCTAVELFVDNRIHHDRRFARGYRRKNRRLLLPIEFPCYAGIETHRAHEMRLYHNAAVCYHSERANHLHRRYGDTLSEGRRVVADLLGLRKIPEHCASLIRKVNICLLSEKFGK